MRGLGFLLAVLVVVGTLAWWLMTLSADMFQVAA